MYLVAEKLKQKFSMYLIVEKLKHKFNMYLAAKNLKLVYIIGHICELDEDTLFLIESIHYIITYT
jgi:hypothetical protein